MRFNDKVVVITGGARGLGRTFSEGLGQEGAKIAIAELDLGAAHAAVEEMKGLGVESRAFQCDVAREEVVAEAFDEIMDVFGRIDILINNAGRHLMKYKTPFHQLSRNEVRELFEVNVIGVINCAVESHKHMSKTGGGVIVNIASTAGHECTTPYGVSKLAVRGLTLALAREFAAADIRVNAISPGLMATESVMGDLPADMIENFVSSKQTIHRLGQPSDLLGAMMFLCSDDSGFMSGETLVVSGGYSTGI